MKFHVVLENQDACERTLHYDSGRLALTAGVGSYISDAEIIGESEDAQVVIGRYSAISYGVSFVFLHAPRTTSVECGTSDALMDDVRPSQIIVIGSDVRIGSGAVLMGGVRIGDGAVVELGSVVTEDVPPYAVVAGNPAQIMRYRFDDEKIAALANIAWWNWPWEEIQEHRALLTGDIATFLKVCPPQRTSKGVEEAVTVHVDADVQRKLDEFQAEIQEFRAVIGQNLRNGYAERVMSDLHYLAEQLYLPSQIFTDDVMEGYLAELLQQLPQEETSWKKHERMRIVFYDGFGIDTRGLSLIYLRALCHMDVDILYITIEQARGRIPTIEKVLQGCSGRIHYLSNKSNSSYIDSYQNICRAIHEFSPNIGFLCTSPGDVSAILAFMQAEGQMKRYQINLTDHAFSLGTHAFDRCLEFRDFGANVSRLYRKIPVEKLRKQPYYPYISEQGGFDGFPFEKMQGDFIIFSGGNIYKTIDRERSYYRIVDFCLRSFPHTKFWYAGSASTATHTAPLYSLQKKYPGRVFISGEQKNLFQVLCHVDLYLNTCPQIGGLMTQYSVLAGRPPYTFLRLPKSAGAESVLLPQREGLGIEFSDMDAFLEELRRFISDPNYRRSKERKLNERKWIITEREFAENLKRILETDQSSYEISWFPVDMSVQKALYADIWAETVR